MGRDAGKPLGHIIVRYILVGAALGLYFGYFFRPVREPSIVTALILAAIAAVVTVALRWFRGVRPTLPGLLRMLFLTFISYALFLFILEGRHLAYDAGGRILTVLFTTISGAVTGAVFAYNQSRAAS